MPAYANQLRNRCENSHQPTPQRERRMQGFKSPGHAQRFLAAALLRNTFDRVGIECPPPSTVKKCRKDTRCGARLRA